MISWRSVEDQFNPGDNLSYGDILSNLKQDIRCFQLSPKKLRLLVGEHNGPINKITE